MGLAYEALTSAFSGTNPAADNENTNVEQYSPIFQSMYTQGLVSPTFTLALERTNSSALQTAGGYISFGGYPPSSVVSFENNFTSTPIELVRHHHPIASV